MTWVTSTSGWRYYKNHIPVGLRNEVIRRDGYHCRYCGHRVGRYRAYETDRPYPKLVVDHVIPRSLGGRTEIDNLVVACVNCNARKSSRTPDQAQMVLLPIPSSPLAVAIAPRIPPM